MAGLLAGLVGPLPGSASEVAIPGAADQIELYPLLDRLAEAGMTDTGGLADLPAMETLMAYLLMAQPVWTEAATMPSLPDDVLSLLQAPTADADPALVQSLPAHLIEVPAPSGGSVGITTVDQLLAETSGGVVTDVSSEGQANLVDDAGDQISSLPQALTANVGDEVVDTTTQPVGFAAADGKFVVDADPSTAQAKLAVASEVPVIDESPSSSRDALSVLADVTRHAPNENSGSASEVPMAPVLASGGTATAVRPEAIVDSRPVTPVTLPAEIADTVRMAAFRGDSEVRLVLNPPELGHLDIRIASGEGGLRITLEASQGSARELIDRSLVQLQQALEARDVRVDRLEVRAADTGRGGMDTTGQQSDGRDGSAGRDAQPEWSPVAALAAMSGEVDSADATHAPVQADMADGRVDVLA